MVLFIDRLPLREVPIHYAGHSSLTWQPLVPVILTDSKGGILPSESPCYPWELDTGNALDASAWRFHLERVGLDLTPRNLSSVSVTARAVNEATEELPVRPANLWLVSNIPSFRPAYWLIRLNPGVPFFNRTPEHPEQIYPLIGVKALRRSRVRLQIDFDALTVSVWVPGPWYQRPAHFLRRIPEQFTTTPLDDLCTGRWT